MPTCFSHHHLQVQAFSINCLLRTFLTLRPSKALVEGCELFFQALRECSLLAIHRCKLSLTKIDFLWINYGPYAIWFLSFVKPLVALF